MHAKRKRSAQAQAIDPKRLLGSPAFPDPDLPADPAPTPDLAARQLTSFDPLLTDHDLERITGRARSTWQKARLIGGPETPPFIRLGRLVRYRQSDVQAWLSARRTYRSTSDADGYAA
jgi:predicted DNA-binding transcriptional regulator AlpA